MINGLFDLWDNNGSGYLDLDEVIVVMKKYKQGLEVEAIESGLKTQEYRRQYFFSIKCVYFLIIR